eukprot:SM000124S25926  [mRNA]  locus=s124:104934:107848:+ [translate_table: standard]
MADPWRERLGPAELVREAAAGVAAAVRGYESYHAYHGGDKAARKSSYTDMVNKYYDLATSFYEYGWGESFHFAHRHGDNLGHLTLMSWKMDCQVLDIGCGVGGPLREVALFSGASVTGLNNNAYQISRGEVLNRKAELENTCTFLKADFMSIPVEDATYDAAYAIEATCHAPDAVACYREIFRVLKPGQCFAAYEWCITDAYDPKNREHQQIKAEIELGNGLPEIRTLKQCHDALICAGFEILEDADLVKTAKVPWYQPIDPTHFSITNFRLTFLGRSITRVMVWTLEKLSIAPAGSYRVAQFLEKGADGLVEGGRKELFTPMYFFLARKPLAAKS